MSVIEHWSDDDRRTLTVVLTAHDAQDVDMLVRAIAEAGYAPPSLHRGAVDLLDKLDAYVGHVNCGVVHGAPECSCGFDDLYTQVRAVVRGGR